jgi:hypothetical protein
MVIKLVELKKDKSLLDLAHLKNDLEDSLNKKVDILTYKSVHPKLSPYIYRDEIKVYEKR